MLRNPLIAVTLLLACVPSVARAQVFEGENLLVTVPEGWVEATSTERGKMLLSEYVPKGQTVDNWQQMITVQVFRGMKQVNPKTFVDKMSSGARNQVEEGAFDAQPMEIAGDPGYASYCVVWVSGKVKATGKGEVTLIRAIQGKDSMYVVQRAWRQASFDSPEQVTVPQAEIQKGIDFLRQVEVVTR
jgi:hypothetical protein